MKRLEHLILEARSNTSNKSTAKISQQDMVNHFNRAQDEIQNIAMSVDSAARILSEPYVFNMVQNQESYDLPSDIYSPNAISSVRISQGSGQFFPIEKITEKERQRGYGYSIIANKIYISPIPKWTAGDQIEITYQKKLRKLGIRSGVISGYVSNTGVITLSAGYSTDIGTYDDFFCIVDSTGAIINADLPIVNFNAGALTTTQGLTIANGNYVVMGKNSSTHSTLSDFCERYLLSYVERKIQSMESSSDFGFTNLFTKEETQAIADIFSTGSKDAIYPPITNTDYLWL